MPFIPLTFADHLLLLFSSKSLWILALLIFVSAFIFPFKNSASNHVNSQAVAFDALLDSSGILTSFPDAHVASTSLAGPVAIYSSQILLQQPFPAFLASLITALKQVLTAEQASMQSSSSVSSTATFGGVPSLQSSEHLCSKAKAFAASLPPDLLMDLTSLP